MVVLPVQGVPHMLLLLLPLLPRKESLHGEHSSAAGLRKQKRYITDSQTDPDPHGFSFLDPDPGANILRKKLKKLKKIGRSCK